MNQLLIDLKQNWNPYCRTDQDKNDVFCFDYPSTERGRFADLSQNQAIFGDHPH